MLQPQATRSEPLGEDSPRPTPRRAASLFKTRSNTRTMFTGTICSTQHNGDYTHLVRERAQGAQRKNFWSQKINRECNGHRPPHAFGGRGTTYLYKATHSKAGGGRNNGDIIIWDINWTSWDIYTLRPPRRSPAARQSTVQKTAMVRAPIESGRGGQQHWEFTK